MLMRILLFWLGIVATMASASEFSSFIDTLDPLGNMKYEQLLESLKFIEDQSLYVRDDGEGSNSSTTLVNILINVYESGIITDLLYEIAQSDTQINNLVNMLAGIVNGNFSSPDSVEIFNLNISINTDDLYNTVLDSGLIPSIAGGLLINETNRNTLADLVGYFLTHEIWVAKLLNELGGGSELSVKVIADTIKNTPNLNPKYNSSIPENKQAIFNFDLLDDLLSQSKANEGSASDFFNNLINGVLSSSLFSTSLTTILNSLNESGIAVPLVMDILTNDTIVSMFPTLVSGLYDKGVFDGLDLNYYYVYAKENALLTDGLQWLLTSPKWEPPLAKLLKRMDDNGVFKDIEDGLFGPND